MAIMIAGLVLFLGIHLLPVFTGARSRLALRLGDNRYRGVFSLVSALGLVLIIAGYSMRPERVQLFAPSPAARDAAPWLVTLAFVLFASANMQTHIRHTVRHPMLIGLAIWSGVHLHANGDLAGTILFGSFFAYSIIDLVSAVQRRAVKVFIPHWKFDVMAVVGGLVLAYLTIRFHPAVFGTGPVA
ncbi:MAG: NnrU family protein [Burkholderiales bacterium]